MGCEKTKLGLVTYLVLNYWTSKYCELMYRLLDVSRDWLNLLRSTRTYQHLGLPISSESLISISAHMMYINLYIICILICIY